MKTYWESGDTASHHRTRWSLTLRPLYPREKSPLPTG